MGPLLAISIAGLGLNLYGAYESSQAAAASAAERKKIAEKQAQYNLAKTTIAKAVQDRSNEIIGVWSGYYLPREVATVNEVCSEPVENANLDMAKYVALGEVIKVYANAKKAKTLCVAPQQIGIRQEVEVLMSIKQAQHISATQRLAVKTENARVRMKNQQRLNNKINMINAGRGHGAHSTGVLEAAAREYSDLSKQLDKDLSTAAYVMGRSLNGLVTAGQEVLKQSGAFGAMFQKQEDIRPLMISPVTQQNDQSNNSGNTIININPPDGYTGETY